MIPLRDTWRRQIALNYLKDADPSMQEKMLRVLRVSRGFGYGADSVVNEVAALKTLLSLGSGMCRHDGVHDFTVVDVGANIGEWTVAVRELIPTASVVAFEPDDSSMSELQSRTASDPRVRAVPLALGLTESQARLWRDVPGSKLASLSKRTFGQGVSFSDSQEISVVSLDNWAASNGVAPDVIKFDIEGHELDALLGAEAVLQQVSVVQFEFGECNVETRTFFRDFFDFFEARNFDLFRLTPRGLISVPRYCVNDEVFKVTNYFARAR